MPPFRGAKVGGVKGVATPTEFSVGKLITYVIMYMLLLIRGVGSPSIDPTK